MNWFQIIVGAAAAFALSFLLHTLDVHRIEAKHTQEMKTQKESLEKQCKDDQALTKGVNDELQKNLDAIDAKLADYKRLHPSRCVVPTSRKAVVANPRAEYAGENGIDTDTLVDYAADCERIRQTGLSCIKFVDDVWKSRDQ